MNPLRHAMKPCFVALAAALSATSGSVAAVTIDGPYFLTAQLQAPTPQTQQLFGRSVALSGTTAIFTAPGQDDGTGTGIANVFEKNGTGGWDTEALVPDYEGGGTLSGLYGCGSAAADRDTLVVGEAGMPVWPHAGQGGADIYSRTDTPPGWQLMGIVFDVEGLTDEGFGCGVALEGETLAIGSYGAKYVNVFIRSGDTWTRQARLSVAAVPAGFGVSLALSGDTLVVGAPFQQNEAGESAGSAYVFKRVGTTWSAGTLLPIPSAFGFTGASVAIDGDTIVVGSPGRTVGTASAAGTVHILKRRGSVWSVAQELLPPSPTGGAFGSSVAITNTRLVVGEKSRSDAHIYDYDGSAWNRSATLTGTTDSAFGSYVATSRTTSEIVVGAPEETVAGKTYAGRAYIFQPDEIFADGLE